MKFRDLLPLKEYPEPIAAYPSRRKDRPDISEYNEFGGWCVFYAPPLRSPASLRSLDVVLSTATQIADASTAGLDPVGVI